MDRAELIDRASPPCHECGLPVQRVECQWERNGDGDWVPGAFFTVCKAQHRVPVKAVWDD